MLYLEWCRNIYYLLEFVVLFDFFHNIAKLSLSSVTVQSNLNWDLALNLVITTPTHPHPGK